MVEDGLPGEAAVSTNAAATTVRLVRREPCSALRGGGSANWSHGLAATYLGVSVAFGPRMVPWADQRFAHRFAGGPPAVAPAAARSRAGAVRVTGMGPSTCWRGRSPAQCCSGWQRWPHQALSDQGQLWGWMARLSVVLVIWFVGWPLRVSLLQSSAAEVWS